jgi:sugar phosphate isomerase/epimerase
MEQGISTHLFLNYTLDAEILGWIAEAGFREIELWGMLPHFQYDDERFIGAAGEMLAKTGLKPYSVHTPFYTTVEEARRGNFFSIIDEDPAKRAAAVSAIKSSMRAGAMLGAKVAILHAGMNGEERSGRQIAAFMENAKAVMESASGIGIRVAVENGINRAGTAEITMEAIDGFPPEKTGICLDVGHANMLGDPLKAIDTVAGRLFSVHISDNNGNYDMHLPPYDGTIDWKKVHKKLAGLKKGFPFTYEILDYQLGDPREKGRFMETMQKLRDGFNKMSTEE